MNNTSTHSKMKYNRFAALLLFLWAMALSSAGILILPIYIYAAAPFYFLAAVFFFAGQGHGAKSCMGDDGFYSDRWL